MSDILNPPKKIVYVGKRDFKRDNVAGTGLVWSGFGDAHMVPSEAAQKMLRHPDVWCEEKDFDPKSKKETAVKEQAKPTESEPENSEEVEPEDEDRKELIKMAAISLMNEADPEKLTEKQKPKLGSIREMLDDDSIALKELNAVLAELEE